MSLNFLFFLWLGLVLVLLGMSNATSDTIGPSQSLKDGQWLVSNGGNFELGFFSPGSSQKRYLGIWYKKIPIQTVVWVANRERPINDSSGMLKINSAGGNTTLMIVSDGNAAVWSSDSSPVYQKEATNPVAVLLDSGNLVLKDADTGNILWQSFDHLTDTMLQGVKLGWDSKTGINRRLSSWKSTDDPAPGDLVYEMGHSTYPEAYVWKGTAKIYRTGPWNGIRFSGAPELKPNPVFNFYFVYNAEEVFYTFELKSVVSIVVLNQTNNSRQRYIWVEAHRAWEVYSTVPRDYCDNYGLCGANSLCVFSDSPVCQCLKGFEPKAPARWNLMDWSQGCVRSKPLQCQDADGFAKFEWVKLPDTTYACLNSSMSLKECRAKCLANCSCTAYTNSDIRGKGSGCVLWFGDLVDIRQSAGGQDLYVRMSTSELGVADGLKLKRSVIIVAIIATISAVLLTSYYLWRRRTNIREMDQSKEKYPEIEAQEEDLELPCFSLATIAIATGSFSANNKLGEGGFGPVYMGQLVNGQQIAVKRLSITSKQGLDELKNEVRLIAKLQHRNLVKLLGCCIEGEERMLIYEYMPNKSLDFFIFDRTREKLLEWPQCFNIICGIARGLLYLHQDSRLRIIHRDLKASNVLLDYEMNPKISDFGLARSFGSDEIEAKTKRVVGTYGYMSPEYAVDGVFSTKSDVFSFGVLLLEIVSGKRNRGFHHPSHNFNLIGHAWKLWKEDRPLDIINALYDYCSSEVLRCIHVGLLCVQQHPEDRPNMSPVVTMLVSEIPMPEPKQPGFFMDRNPFEDLESSSSRSKQASENKVSMSMLEAR